MSTLSKSTDSTNYKCSKCRDTGYFFFKDENGYEFSKKCECGLADIKAMETNLKFASIPETFKDVTLDNYRNDIFDDPMCKAMIARNLKIARNYVKDFEQYNEKGIGLYLYSDCKGSGKTRMAISIANELIKKGIPVKFATSLQIINEIKATWDERNTESLSESKLLDQLMSVKVLIIDDFGTEKTKDWITERFYSLVNGRYINKKPTIFTSNIKLDQLEYDDRIIDRIYERCYKLEFPEESVRRIKAKQNELDLMKMLEE